jgi:alkylhydroperoxidase family enzyme
MMAQEPVMPFFAPVPEEQLSPELRRLIDIARKRAVNPNELGPRLFVMAGHPRLLKAFVEAREDLNPIPNRFGAGAFIAGMLIAHSVGCRACFALSRGTLVKVGFDEKTLDSYCATPANLPLPDGDRKMVEFTVRLACERNSVKASDYHEMKRTGFSQEDLLEMIGIAAFWNLATTIAIGVDAGLADE